MNFDRLAQRIDGEVIDGGSPEYIELPKPNNARFDQLKPQAVVLCKTSHDAAEPIAFIRRHGLRSATRCGGHCFAGRSSTSGVPIDVSPMNSVSVSNGVASLGAGAKLGAVYDRLLARGLTIPGGTCPSVGIAGLVLGGGLGMLGRKHGLACDHLAAARIVLASGRDLATGPSSS